MVRTIRRLIDEEERTAGKASTPVTKKLHPESAPAEETKPKAPITYQVSEQPSTRVQEEEFAKQLRLARYLAAGGSPPSRALEPAPEAKTPKRERPVAKAGAKTSRARSVRKLGTKNWPRKGGGRDGWVRRCRLR